MCVRCPGGQPGQRRQEIRKYATYYGVLREMCGWLQQSGVTIVAMSPRGVPTRPGGTGFYLRIRGPVVVGAGHLGHYSFSALDSMNHPVCPESTYFNREGRFRSAGGAQRFLSPFSGISPHFRPRRHLPPAAWRQVTGCTTTA